MEEEIDISKDPSFADYFKTFSSLISSIKELIGEILAQNNKKNEGIYDLVKEKIYIPCEDEFKEVFGPAHNDWTKRKSTYLHCLIVTYLSSIDKRYQELDEKDKNILLWSSLLHDINKRSKECFEGPDRIHPFRCGGTTLQIFCRNNIIPPELHDKALEVSELVMNANKLLDDEEKLEDSKLRNRCTVMHDHSKLDQIFTGLNEILSNLKSNSDFIRKVFCLVLFHQSLNGIKKFKPTAVMTDEEILQFVPEDILDLLSILMNSDSLSRSLICNTIEYQAIDNKATTSYIINHQYKEEIKEEISRIQLLFKSKVAF